MQASSRLRSLGIASVRNFCTNRNPSEHLHTQNWSRSLIFQRCFSKSATSVPSVQAPPPTSISLLPPTTEPASFIKPGVRSQPLSCSPNLLLARRFSAPPKQISISAPSSSYIVCRRTLFTEARSHCLKKMPVVRDIDRSSASSLSSCTTCGSPGRKVSTPASGPLLIGVAGGTASGKSTVCKKIIDILGQTEVNNTEKQVVAISQDSFYRNLNPDEIIQAKKGKFNFDHPDAFDNDLMASCLRDILEGRPTKIPVYDFKENARVPGKFTTVYPSDVILVEGILVFYYPNIRDLFKLKLFVDTDADTRLARRVLRDIEERGRDLEHVLTQYTNLVKPAFEEFCIPTKKYADVIIPRGAENTVAIELIVQNIQDHIWRSNGSKNGSPFNRSRSNSDSRLR